MADKDFVVKNGLVVSTNTTVDGFIANSTQFTFRTANTTSNGFLANSTAFTFGNSTVNVIVNTSTISISGITGIKIVTTSNVNATTDYITITAHGYSTGDAIYYNNGGGVSITISGSSLDSVTTYYVRKIDNDNIRLAPTSTDATNGTNLINITGTGNDLQYFSLRTPTVVANSTGAINSFNLGGSAASLYALK